MLRLTLVLVSVLDFVLTWAQSNRLLAVAIIAHVTVLTRAQSNPLSDAISHSNHCTRHCSNMSSSSPSTRFGFCCTTAAEPGCRRGLCHTVSVRPSVTFVYCFEMSKFILKLFSPSGNHAVLVFPYQKSWQYSDGVVALNAYTTHEWMVEACW